MASVKIDDSLNYADHEIKAKALMKEVHTFLLRNDFPAACSTIDQTIAELRLMRMAVKSHVKE